MSRSIDREPVSNSTHVSAVAPRFEVSFPKLAPKRWTLVRVEGSVLLVLDRAGRVKADQLRRPNASAGVSCVYQVMEASQIISARKDGSTFAELARVFGKPEAEVRAIINSHKMNLACAMPLVT